MLISYRYLVIIPAYNEETTIEQLVTAAQQYADVCVVDDASKDHTPEILRQLEGVHVIRHEKNTHIAGAILDGMRYALDAGYDYCITMNCGLSHDPHAIPQFQQYSDADLVIGYRHSRVDVPVYRRALSKGGNFLVNLALPFSVFPPRSAGLSDVTSGFRMYSRRAFSLLVQSQMKSRSFDFHLEALAIIYRNRLVLCEIPITYVYSNSSLRWKIVYEVLRTWMRIWSSKDYGMALPNMDYLVEGVPRNKGY